MSEKRFADFDEAMKFVDGKGVQWFFKDTRFEYGVVPETVEQLQQLRVESGDHAISNLSNKLKMRTWQREFAETTGIPERDVRVRAYENWAPTLSLFAKAGDKMFRIEQDPDGSITFRQMVANKVTRRGTELAKVTDPESTVCKKGNSADFVMALWNIARDTFMGPSTPVPQPASDLTAVDLMGALAETMKVTFSKHMADQLAPSVYETIRQKIIEEFGMVPERLEVKMVDESHTVEGITHKSFPLVLHLIANDEPVYCYGPAGSGKGYLAKQVAEALGLDYYFMNSVTDEFKLTGFIDAMGNYHETPFFKAFTQGGLFTLDELDASAPEVLVNINMALADKHFTFPTGQYEAHPNFRVIAAGNTLGTGSDASYTGRFQLDAATLNRFTVIEVGYDDRIDNQMAGGDAELVEFAHLFRAACERNGIDALCSYRNIRQIRVMKACEQAGLPTVIKSCVTRAMNDDDVSMVAKFMRDSSPNNKYVLAMEGGRN